MFNASVQRRETATKISSSTQSKISVSLLVQMTRWSVSAASLVSCMLLTTASLVSGQAVISLLEPRDIVSHRPGQFDLNVHKTGGASTPATIIVEVRIALADLFIYLPLGLLQVAYKVQLTIETKLTPNKVM